MNGRPLARRTRTPVHTRRTRPVRRASAGLSTVRAGAALAMLVSAAAIYGVGGVVGLRLREARSSRASSSPTPAAVEARPRRRPVARTCSAVDRARSLAALERLPTVDHARIDVRLPATLAVTIEEREPILVWQVGERALPGRRRRRAVRAARRRAAGRRAPALPGRRGPPGRRRPASSVGSHARPGRPRRGDPAGLAHAGRRRQPGGRAGRRVTDENGFVARPPGRRAGRRSSASTPRACARPSSSRARSASCAACSTGASRRSTGSSSPRRPTGRTCRGRRPSRRPSAKPSKAP